ncbi:hypothetical protein CH377_17600 [Leptospira haakeii]|nr:RHS repeat-associated core domain-containing protein [Leptospira haakeii]PKA18438.1 hypothetical protein CH377_17600 [Leptospira haakeii]
MNYGPDQNRVMKTPLPKDEAKLEKGFAAIPILGGTKSLLLDYVYDGNQTPGKGEIAYAGCFTADDCSASPELLLFDRNAGVFNLKKGTGYTSGVLTSFLPEATGVATPFGGRPDRYTRSTKDEVLYFKKNGSMNQFFVVRNSSGTAFETANLAGFTDTQVGNFNISESAYVVDNFESASYKSVLILDDQATAGTGRFILTSQNGVRALAPAGDVVASYLLGRLDQSGNSGTDRLSKNQYSFFSGDFTGVGKAQILLVDRSGGVHNWYLGTLDIAQNKIQFKKLINPPNLPFTSAEFDSINAAGISYGIVPETTGNSILIGKASGANIIFSKYRISGTTYSVTKTQYTAGSAAFNGLFDYEGNPILNQGGDNKIYDISADKVISPSGNVITAKLDRPDLMTKVYVFIWIQGDYNGDGLTDIGIIHLKEPTWYFAMSDGIVPDVMQTVKNGIGGSYEFEYTDSTKFDNTGGDGVPDLPGSYRVCTKITADDGFSNRIFKTYEYSNGYAFSAFINGKVEKDFFGFGNFTEKDPYGVRKARQYNNIPYSDFMMNRALSGAEKESHLVGTDNQDYGSILRTYDIKKIETSAGITSYMVIPTLQENYIKGIKTKTTGQNLELSGYNLSKKTETNTDLFADSAHPSVSITNITEFETVSLSNQTRTKKSINLAGSSNEVSTSITYDTQGNPIRSVTSYTGSGLGSVAPMITEITYDTLGNQISQKDVSGNPARGTDFVYDTQLKQFVVEKTSFGGSIRLKNLYTIDYTNAFGTPLQATDPNGNKTIYEYDSYARTVKISADTDSGTKVLATYSYDSSFPLSAKSVLISGTWDPDFALREYADGLARTVYKVKTASEGKAVRTGRIVYDGAGRISRSGQADWTDTGNLDHFSLHMEEKNPTVFEYDAIGRVTTATLPLAAGETSPTILTTVYNDPYESIEIHSGGTNKRTVKDARGQTLYVEDSGSDGVVAQIGFCYNLAGNRTKKSDLNDGTPLNCSDISTGVANKDVSGKNQAYWAYDGFGKVKVQSDPDLGLQKFEYNAFGNISKSTDAKNIITTFGYDPLGRMNTKVQPEGTTYLTYDSLSGSQNSLGKLVKVEDQVQTKTFSYDKLGRVKKETRSFKNIPLKNGDVPYITEYEYDLLGRVSKVDYPAHPVNHSRLRACYNYGTAGYISDISVQVNTNGILPGLCNKTVVENITYNEFNQTAGFTLGNGVATNYTYDARQRLVRLQSSGDVDGTTKVLQDAIYTFNSRNNIINIANTASDYTTQYDYEYDGLNRLVNAQGTYFEPTDAYTKQFRQSFDYAKNGNLIAKRSHNFSTGAILDERLYQYDNHQVRRIDSSKYGSDTLSMNYDASGNMIRQRDQVLDLTKQMEYDSENRIVRIRDKDNYTIGTYSYDEGGFRVHKSALVPDGAQYKHQEILYPNKFYGLEYMDDENVLRSINNIYLNGVRIAAITEDGRAAFYLADQVDSVSTVLDDNAHTLSRMQYEPYGDTFVQRGNLAFSPKYNSQELDKESGFYFYNARYYDASIARFVTADTIIDGEFNTQGWNRFSYVKGNPILYKDPTGHEAGWFDNLTSKIKGAFGGKSKLDEYNDKVDSMNSIPKNNNTATNQKEGTGSGKANQILSNPFRIGIKKKEEKSWWNAFSGENDSKNKPDSKSEKKVEEYEEMQLYPDGPIVTFWLPKKVQKAGEYVDAAAGVTQSLENDRFYTEPDGEGNDVMHNEFGSKAAYYYHKNGEDIFKCNPYQTCKVPMEIDTTSKLESVSDKLTNGKQKPATQYNSNNTTTGARQ